LPLLLACGARATLAPSGAAVRAWSARQIRTFLIRPYNGSLLRAGPRGSARRAGEGPSSHWPSYEFPDSHVAVPKLRTKAAKGRPQCERSGRSVRRSCGARAGEAEVACSGRAAAPVLLSLQVFSLVCVAGRIPVRIGQQRDRSGHAKKLWGGLSGRGGALWVRRRAGPRSGAARAARAAHRQNPFPCFFPPNHSPSYVEPSTHE
jgi:hypothetical protein